MIDVSFLLPTNRSQSHPDVLQKAIDSINVLHSDLMNYEILVYSQFPVEGHNVTWIKEETRLGPLAAFNTMGSTIAKGEYLVCMVDDHAFTSSIQGCIDVVEGTLYRDRTYKIIGLSPNGAPSPASHYGVFSLLGATTCPIPNKGDRMGDSIIAEQLPNASTLRFPVVRKDTLSKYLSNHIFHPDLFYHAGDIWLGYFLHCNGEPSCEGPTSIVGIAPLKDSSYENEDCNTVYKLIKNHLAGCSSYIPTEY